jgi:hypothetical protein
VIVHEDVLAVDQQRAEGPRRQVRPVGADRVRLIGVREHQDVEELGAGSGAEAYEDGERPQLSSERQQAYAA